MLFLVLQKTEEKGLPESNSIWHSNDSDTDLAVPFADDSTQEDEEQDCVFCTGRFSVDHNGEDWIRCAKYFRWAHTLCAGTEEDFVCDPCQGQTQFCS
jgi:hypothetical protein